MLLSNIPSIISWILLYFASTPTMLYIPMALGGLVGGLVEGPVLNYVSEITQPHLRGPLSATASMGVIVGVFIQFAIGSVVDWRHVALINITFPVLCVIALSIVPESPYWLAGKRNRTQKFSNFLGWVFRLMSCWLSMLEDTNPSFVYSIKTVGVKAKYKGTNLVGNWIFYKKVPYEIFLSTVF